MNPKNSDRRRFLKNGAALAGLAVGASASALPLAAEPAPEKVDELHLYGERSHFVNSIRNGSINNPERRLKDEAVAFGLRTPLQDSVGMITPSALHFTISHGFEPPDINPEEHHLLIHGMVDRFRGRTKTPALRNPISFHRVPRQQFHERSRRGCPDFGECDPTGNARIHQLQPMDRSSALPVAQRGRRAKRRDMDHRGRRR
jgi:hypothetical protein